MRELASLRSPYSPSKTTAVDRGFQERGLPAPARSRGFEISRIPVPAFLEAASRRASAVSGQQASAARERASGHATGVFDRVPRARASGRVDAVRMFDARLGRQRYGAARPPGAYAVRFHSCVVATDWG